MGIEHPAPPLPGHAQWADLAMLVALGALAVAIARGELRWSCARSLGGVLAALGAWLAWLGVSTIASGARPWKLAGAIELAGVLLIATQLAADGASRDRVVRAWIAGAAALCVLGLLGAALAVAGVPTLLQGDPEGGNLGVAFRPVGLCVTTNYLAQLCLAPLCVLALDGARLFSRRTRALLLALLGVTVALTLSRTLLALGVAALVAWSLRGPRARRRIAIAGVLAIAALGLPSLRLHVRHDAAGWQLATTPGIRWRVMSSALDTARAHPLVGVGPDALPASAAWDIGGAPREWTAHDTPLDVAATSGVPALVALCALAGLTLRRARRTSPLDVALCAAALATLFDALSIDAERFRHVWLLFGLL
jgi:hypothetical protein